MIKVFAKKYETENPIFSSSPVFLAEDLNREKIEISLSEVTSVKEPTDIQFYPTNSRYMFLLEKKGNLIVFDREEKKQRTLLSLKVVSESELGLLGLCFHPDFPKVPNAYLNYTKDENGKDTSIISEWTIRNPDEFEKMSWDKERILLKVSQPYPNHNAGQIAFGRDKMLYIGWGDGGLRGDPQGNGQNTKTMLGSILRINPKADTAKNTAYTIPSDNPFVGKADVLPEIYAYGLRNPWRYSFSSAGSLVLADVGQDAYEEIDIIESGKNYGWSQTEGNHCYQSNCNQSEFASPIYEYGRGDGQSITGGYEYLAKDIANLRGKYVFGDFISGKIWAFDLPKDAKTKVEKVYTLGKWNVLISTFGQDPNGDLFLADYQSGKIMKFVPLKK
ncbi:glucose/sorbosone dehydrogenase [Leptospira ryugenii]|uniref:Glucose/sorbosone dehydrogenase n=2 Tax=Leptospira ryugenii TaxID=1917863 RepID=A0A2P2DY86_9LEPT|nr:glucose/sorbosone dehydrogenase [Leptospira ryugenii]